MENTREAAAWKLLRSMRPAMTRQQFLTIKGQIKAGDVEGALAGLERIRHR